MLLHLSAKAANSRFTVAGEPAAKTVRTTSASTGNLGPTTRANKVTGAAAPIVVPATEPVFHPATATSSGGINPFAVGFNEGDTRPAFSGAMLHFFGPDYYRNTALALGGTSSDTWNAQLSAWSHAYDSIDKHDNLAVQAWVDEVAKTLTPIASLT